MSDNEVEKFEITDYDLDNEFNINRPVRRISKNQQIYGIWADDSDDDTEKAGKSRPGFRGSGAPRHNYTAPVSFVSGGVQQSKNKEKAKEKETEDGASDSEEEMEHSGKRGPDDYRNSSSEEEEEEVAPSTLFRQQQYPKETHVDGEIAGLRRKKNSNYAPLQFKGVGNWEKHTKGIGAKLLLQMGYQPGKGLGKDLQGISAPVEAQIRKGRGAIGAYGPEKVQRIADKPSDAEKDDDSKEGSERLSQWRKGETWSKKKKVRYVYKSVDEVLQQGTVKPSRPEYSHLSKVKVIDMTGPQQRVLSGYHAISGQQRPSDEWEVRKDKKFSNFALPELQHNLNLLMDMCEQEIIQNDRKLRHESDRLVALEQEEATLSKAITQEEQQMERLEAVLSAVERLSTGSVSMEEALVTFRELQEKYYEEYFVYEVGDLAATAVGPSLRNSLKSWQPLIAPAEPLTQFCQWREVLEGQRGPLTAVMAGQQTPFHKLLWEAWMPSIRTAAQAWDCHSCEPMIDLLQKWAPVVPPWILDNIREQLILPKIQLEVEQWNPMTDTIPIHAWIHPWLPLLGTRLESTVYPVIRHKLSKALVNWHPSDRSARLMLLPWHKVFDRGEMDAFLVKNILPKLQLAMQELTINPHQQILEQWHWVMEWEDLIPIHSMCSLLENFFFPKWLQILTLWLNHLPNYDEVTNWYMGWKGLLSENMLNQPTIKEQFRKALELMNRAVSGPGQPGPMEPPIPPYMTSPLPSMAQRNKERDARMEYMAEAVRVGSQIPLGFKELIQKRCEERGILFVPLPNRYREGKQVYRCGNVQIYIDRNVVFVSDNGSTWAPVSLNVVLDKAM